MTGPIWVDIFETKGIEYLLIIVFLLAFIVFIRSLFKGGRGGDKTAGGKRD